MARVFKNWVRQTTDTTGLGTYDLDGAAPTGFKGFVEFIGDTNTCIYEVTNGTDREINLGTVADLATDTLTRDTLIASTTGSAINWGAGTKDIFVVNPAEEIEKQVQLDATQTLTAKTLTAPTINGVVGGTATSMTITTMTGNVIGNLTGNADTSTVLATSRNFSISGGGISAATVGFTGAGNVILSASVDTAHITLARMANMATASFIGRDTAATGVPEILDKATALGILNAEDGATADQTGAEIKTAYEGESDTNAFTDAEQTLLGNQSNTNTGDEAVASTSVSGTVELLTQTEMDTGTDPARVPTAAILNKTTLIEPKRFAFFVG